MWTGLGIRPRLGRRDAEEAKEGEAFRGSPTALPADQESSEGARQGHPSLAGCFFFFYLGAPFALRLRHRLHIQLTFWSLRF